MSYDLAELQSVARELLVAMRTEPGNYARVRGPAWNVVLAIRGPNPGHANLGPGWAYLKAADRRLLRQLHDALCGRDGTYYPVSHPEDTEHLAESVLAITLGRRIELNDSEAPTRTAPSNGKHELSAKRQALEAGGGPDAAELANLLTRQNKVISAALVRYMADRGSAPFEDVAHKVHGARVTDATIRSNVKRTNTELEALAAPLRFRCAGGSVHKESLASDTVQRKCNGDAARTQRGCNGRPA